MNKNTDQSYLIPEGVWLLVYNNTTKKVIIKQEPLNHDYVCATPHVVVTFDTEEELQQFILDNNLIENEF